MFRGQNQRQQEADGDDSFAVAMGTRRTKRLEDEISVDALVHSMMDPFTTTGTSTKGADIHGVASAPGATSPEAANGTGKHTSVDTRQRRNDEVSVMTDDQSRFTQISTAVGAVLTQSLALLRGENPELEQQEATVRTDSQISPINTVTLPTTSSELPLQNEEGLASSKDKNDCSGSTASIDFLKDDPKDMTYGRIIALKLMDKKWYNPRSDAGNEPSRSDEDNGRVPHVNGGTTGPPMEISSEHLPQGARARLELQSNVVKAHAPSLEKAWAYFEHVTL